MPPRLGLKSPPTSFKGIAPTTPSAKALSKKPVTQRPTSFHALVSNATRLRAFTNPAILRRILSFVSWKDFRALTQTGRVLRTLVDTPTLKHVVLARFVKHYAWCLSIMDDANFVDVSITIHDLDLFIASTNVPLHSYPMHAVESTSSLFPSLDSSNPVFSPSSKRLVSLCQAHNKIVLLLQSIIHSSSLPPFPDPCLLDQTLSSSFSPTRQRHSTRGASALSRPRLRELVFPEPLSAQLSAEAPKEFGQQSVGGKTSLTMSSGRLPGNAPFSHQAKSASSPSLASASNPPTSFSLRSKVRSPSRDSAKESDRSSRRSRGRQSSSIFEFSAVSKAPLPLPRDPRELTHHSKSWRKSLFDAWNAHEMKVSKYQSHQKAATTPAAMASMYDESDEELYPPPSLFDDHFPRRSSSNSRSGSGSSSSSLVNLPESHATPPTSYSLPPSPTRQCTNLRQQSHYGQHPFSFPSASPHSLALATHPARAPILRAFVPCTHLDVDAEPILAIEKQLVDSGIWSSLSTGDVVCNLGYVPDSDSQTPGSGPSSSQGYGSSNGYSSPQRRGSAGGSEEDEGESAYGKRAWLIFDGEKLVPFAATAIGSAPPPIADPVSLPSPFYYAHLLPSTSASAGSAPSQNPVFNFCRVPVNLARPGEAPVPSIIQSTCRVPSPHSPMGCALVKRPRWVVSFSVDAMSGDSPQSTFEPVGKGWWGEWVLEAEGTEEGRRMLEEMSTGGSSWIEKEGPLRVEVVREKCSVGRLWIRLVAIF
ncbi:hypothetical protein BDV98DRAFT_581111 [Pterulicium gracile]|uniref:F-box domain-containing protein n=1 Tax=Pterulicium gracile TaxID=1884261 RepID=A0A5C3QQ38_9AGAR|nr:hypothetical protein BDV98DRAFT_581111 [Pterula gracilis]